MKRIWLIGTPEFGNLGDHKISEVELEFLRDRYRIEEIEEVTMTEYWKKASIVETNTERRYTFFSWGR